MAKFFSDNVEKVLNASKMLSLAYLPGRTATTYANPALLSRRFPPAEQRSSFGCFCKSGLPLPGAKAGIMIDVSASTVSAE